MKVTGSEHLILLVQGQDQVYYNIHVVVMVTLGLLKDQ